MPLRARTFQTKEDATETLMADRERNREREDLATKAKLVKERSGTFAWRRGKNDKLPKRYTIIIIIIIIISVAVRTHFVLIVFTT